MGNRQATDNRKSTTTPADNVTAVEDGDRKQSQPEASKKRRRGRGRKVTDVATPQASGLRGPSHPELITTTTLDTGEDDGTGTENRRLLHLTIYRSYSGAGSNGSAVSRGQYIRSFLKWRRSGGQRGQLTPTFGSEGSAVRF